MNQKFKVTVPIGLTAELEYLSRSLFFMVVRDLRPSFAIHGCQNMEVQGELMDPLPFPRGARGSPRRGTKWKVPFL